MKTQITKREKLRLPWRQDRRSFAPIPLQVLYCTLGGQLEKTNERKALRTWDVPWSHLLEDPTCWTVYSSKSCDRPWRGLVLWFCFISRCGSGRIFSAMPFRVKQRWNSFRTFCIRQGAPKGQWISWRSFRNGAAKCLWCNVCHLLHQPGRSNIKHMCTVLHLEIHYDQHWEAPILCALHFKIHNSWTWSSAYDVSNGIQRVECKWIEECMWIARVQVGQRSAIGSTHGNVQRKNSRLNILWLFSVNGSVKARTSKNNKYSVTRYNEH